MATLQALYPPRIRSLNHASSSSRLLTDASRYNFECTVVGKTLILASLNNPASSPLDPSSAALDRAAGNESAIVPHTPLTAALSESVAGPLTVYRGATTLKKFSEPSSELAAMLTVAGVYDLGWRDFLRCAGEDRVRWLNGMVTNSVAALAANQGCYAFVLNAQGRIQGDLSIFQLGNALWLQTDQSQTKPLTAFLDRFIIMDDVTLEPFDGWTALGIAGPQALRTLATAGFSVAGLPPMHLAEALWNGHSVVLASMYGPRVPRYEIWCSPADALEIWQALVVAGATPCGAEAVEHLRIVEGTPAYSVDITDRDLPQETGQARALHFSKGCYLGQEIVERIRSRGNVHRTFSGFVLPDGFVVTQPDARIPLMSEDKAVGELSSIARIYLGGAARVLALGTVRREALERKAPLTAQGCIVTPASLPFDFAAPSVQP
jgi:folate-binding protein YgfZ